MRSTFNSPLPRYSTLAICVRAALYGQAGATVRHMIERNRMLDDAKALDQFDRAIRQARQA